MGLSDIMGTFDSSYGDVMCHLNFYCLWYNVYWCHCRGPDRVRGYYNRKRENCHMGWKPEILEVALMAAAWTCRVDRRARGRYYRWPNL